MPSKKNPVDIMDDDVIPETENDSDISSDENEHENLKSVKVRFGNESITNYVIGKV